RSQSIRARLEVEPDQPPASPLIAPASFTSRSVTPPESWLVSRKSTRFQTLVNSGWWSAFSAWRATRARKPNASLKSLNLKVRASALPPSSNAQPSGASISDSPVLHRLIAPSRLLDARQPVQIEPWPQ